MSNQKEDSIIIIFPINFFRFTNIKPDFWKNLQNPFIYDDIASGKGLKAAVKPTTPPTAPPIPHQLPQSNQLPHQLPQSNQLPHQLHHQLPHQQSNQQSNQLHHQLPHQQSNQQSKPMPQSNKQTNYLEKTLTF